MKYYSFLIFLLLALVLWCWGLGDWLVTQRCLFLYLSLNLNWCRLFFFLYFHSHLLNNWLRFCHWLRWLLLIFILFLLIFFGCVRLLHFLGLFFNLFLWSCGWCWWFLRFESLHLEFWILSHVFSQKFSNFLIIFP